MRARELLGLFFVLLGLLFGSLARAQDTRPAPFGPCSAWVTSESAGQPHADGTWFVWFCSDAFSVTPHWRALRYDFKLKAPAAASTPAGVFDSFQAANMTTPAGDPSLSGLRDAALAWAAANAPPAPRWIVAKNGTTTTRPVYLRNADGTRATTALAGIRATVGAPCTCADPARRVGDGTGSTYCDPRAVTPVVVTLCTRAP